MRTIGTLASDALKMSDACAIFDKRQRIQDTAKPN
jgi:hypothetical protein